MAAARGQTSRAGLDKLVPELCSLSMVNCAGAIQSRRGSGHTVRCSPSSFSNVAKPKFFREPLLHTIQATSSHNLDPVIISTRMPQLYRLKMHWEMQKNNRQRLHTGQSQTNVGLVHLAVQ